MVESSLVIYWFVAFIVIFPNLFRALPNINETSVHAHGEWVFIKMLTLSHLLLKLLFQKKLIVKGLGLLQCSIYRSTDSCLQICETALSFCSGSTTAHMYTCLNALCFAEMVVCICNVRKIIPTGQKFLVICYYSHWLLNENFIWEVTDHSGPLRKVQHIKTQR